MDNKSSVVEFAEGLVGQQSITINVPRYRNPSNKSMTWTGRGRIPAWVKDYEAAGGSRNDLRIAS